MQVETKGVNVAWLLQPAESRIHMIRTDRGIVDDADVAAIARLRNLVPDNDHAPEKVSVEDEDLRRVYRLTEELVRVMQSRGGIELEVSSRTAMEETAELLKRLG